MPTTTPAHPVDTWPGLYRDNWVGIATDACMAHPAKFAKGLAFRLVAHALEEGWLWPGATCLDPFGGVALGALPCLLQGIHWVGCELEGRFQALAHGFDCGGSRAKHEACSQHGDHAPHHVTGNLELWQRRYGHLPQYVAPTLLQGDSRRLAEVLREQVTCCVSSPPYASSNQDYAAGWSYINHGKGTPATPARGRRASSNKEATYGISPAQLGNLPPGSLDACLSSPPFCNSDNRDKDRARLDRLHAAVVRDGHGHGGKLGPSISQDYGSDPAQLGNLPAGTVEAVVSSPPWMEETNSKSATPSRARLEAGASPGSMDAIYGTTPGQLGATGDAACNPTCTLCGGRKRGARRCHCAEPAWKFRGEDLGHTFWEASKQILAQVVALLKPNGIAVWVVKSYVRNGQIVDFPGQWRTLCESLGLVTLHEHHALLVEDHGTQGGLFGADTTHTTHRKSFFRRLHEKKRPDLAINHEVVYCMQKPLDTAPGSLDACLSSPPYAGAGEVLGAHHGIDYSKVTGTGQRLTPGRAMQPYGQSEGQLGTMRPGRLDARRRA